MHTIVKKSFVQVESLGAARPAGVAGRIAAAASSAGARCKKSVKLLRLDAATHALEVTCSCGEVTVVELEHPPQES